MALTLELNVLWGLLDFSRILAKKDEACSTAKRSSVGRAI
jgi:hypothetical protein